MTEIDYYELLECERTADDKQNQKPPRAERAFRRNQTIDVVQPDHRGAAELVHCGSGGEWYSGAYRPDRSGRSCRLQCACEGISLRRDSHPDDGGGAAGLSTQFVPGVAHSPAAQSPRGTMATCAGKREEAGFRTTANYSFDSDSAVAGGGVDYSSIAASSAEVETPN